MSVLVPCTACQRHVRSSEQDCPFCGEKLPANLASRAVPAATRRLDRLATFTFAAAVSVAACSGSGGPDISDPDRTHEESEDELRKKRDGGAKDAAKDSGCREIPDQGAIVAMYGMPPVDALPPCPRDAGPVQEEDSGGIQALYGMPPVDPPEEEIDGGGFQALYGLPPIPN